MKAEQKHLPAILSMLQKFHAASGMEAPFNSEHIGQSLEQMIELDNFCLLVTETNGVADGVLGGVITPMWFNLDILQASEMFWWSDGGKGLELKAEYEAWALSMGASYVNMAALERIRPKAIGRFYIESGYKLFEHGYTKGL